MNHAPTKDVRIDRLLGSIRIEHDRSAATTQLRIPGIHCVRTVRTVHYLFSRVLMVIIALHIAGALYHTLMLKDGLLRRMWFGRRSPSPVQGVAVKKPISGASS